MKRSVSRRWYWPAILACVVVLEIGFLIIGHQTDSKLHGILKAGSPSEQVHAMFVLAGRGEWSETKRSTKQLLESEESLLREWTMVTSYAGTGDAHLQREMLERAGRDHGTVRARFFHDHRVGRFKWITIASLSEYLAAVEEIE